MNRRAHRHGLCLCLIMPVVGPTHIETSGDAAGPGCRTVEYRPVDIFVDDLPVGHPVPPLHHINMKTEPSTGYGAKSRIVQ